MGCIFITISNVYQSGTLGVWFLQLFGHRKKAGTKERNACTMGLGGPVESNHKLSQKYECMRVTIMMAYKLAGCLTCLVATKEQMEVSI